MPLLSFFRNGLPKENVAYLPLTFTFPKSYKIERREGIVYAATPEDFEIILPTGSYEDNKNGVFAMSVSLRVGYDAKIDKFQGEDPEKQKREMENRGMRHIELRRADANGIPVYSISGEQNGRYVFIAYIALRDTGSAFKVIYQHPKQVRDVDFEHWRSFVNGLGSVK